MITIRNLGLQDYAQTLEKMRAFTAARTDQTEDEIWVLQHNPVFTQGQAGKPEHLLNPDNIPVVQSDRGGQVTYHGPGQLIIYLLIDIKRLKLGVRQLVDLIEQSIIGLLTDYGIDSRARKDAPGVYVNDSKIAALGLRIRKGCSYHGLSLNIDMDLKPFGKINPCGMEGLEVTQMSAFGINGDISEIEQQLLKKLTECLYNDAEA
ncbi:MAG: lipoyl(octanoyl) transferase LipB [Pseudomonadales bacterium]|nr:lipoyl(octanoyl) transferase LipB [Pseudomonadales bacterium]